MFDVLISGGHVIDGSGAPRQRADVGITAGLVQAVGALRGSAAHRTLDASGCIVAPGFIDSHTHDDRLLLQHPARHPKLLQGVTTVVTGNCGISLAPLLRDAAHVPPPLDLLGGPYTYASFSSYVDALRAVQPSLNAALLVGHTTLRVAHVQDLALEANADEVRHMQAALAAALQAGAIGMSTGVYYPPARAATTAEMIAVGEPLRGSGGVLTMHLRDEADHIDAALAEAFAVGRALGVPLVLSHHKLVGLRNHGRSAHTLALVAAAAGEQAVCLDCYPYTASSTMLLPERVASARDVQITWSQPQPHTAGRLLSELAAERGVSAQALAAELAPGGAIYFAMSDVDVDRILAHPLTMVGSDGLAHPDPAHVGQPHPRLWGTFPRVLGHYARDRQVLSLETAVHKMTGLPARRFGLVGRGLLQRGAAADVTVFDPATVADQATYANPTAAPTGLAWVLVNGQVVVDHGQGTGVRAGQLLLRPRA
jgi:N-acyl-D-amino-acid deacylase